MSKLPYDIKDALKYVDVLRLARKERSIVIFLKDYKITGTLDITLKSYKGYVISDEELAFNICKACNCNQIIFCHNHPGQTCVISDGDIDHLKSMIEMSKKYDIKIIDYLIICMKDYYSEAEHN